MLLPCRIRPDREDSSLDPFSLHTALPSMPSCTPPRSSLHLPLPFPSTPQVAPRMEPAPSTGSGPSSFLPPHWALSIVGMDWGRVQHLCVSLSWQLWDAKGRQVPSPRQASQAPQQH